MAKRKTLLERLDTERTQGPWQRWSPNGTSVLDGERRLVAAAQYRRASGGMTPEEHANTEAISLVPELLAVARAAAELQDAWSVLEQTDLTRPDSDNPFAPYEAATKRWEAAQAALDAALTALADKTGKDRADG